MKCDETEAGRSENTLKNVKNYKITRKCQKKIYLCTNNFYTLFGTVSRCAYEVRGDCAMITKTVMTNNFAILFIIGAFFDIKIKKTYLETKIMPNIFFFFNIIRLLLESTMCIITFLEVTSASTTL